MLVKFWGVRGALSTPESNKLKVGGNTSCIEINLGDKQIILDAGTGIRPLGKVIAKNIIAGKGKNIYIFLSHTHWDHIQGFPVFAPAFFSDAVINIFGPAKANRKLDSIFTGQLAYDYWPVKFNHLPARIRFYELNEGLHTLMDGITVTVRRHIHPGVAFGYRFDYKGHSVVYSTDTEHFQNSLDKRVIELSENADLLIHDAQYNDDEIQSRLGWGHSTWKQAIQVAVDAKVKKLALFHHDPERPDETAFKIEKEARIIFPETQLAIEGNEIEF